MPHPFSNPAWIIFSNLLSISLLSFFFLFFFYDILVYSPTIDTHLDPTTQVFTEVTKANFMYNFQNSYFWKHQLNISVTLFQKKVLNQTKQKLNIWLIWPIPTTVEQLSGLLGLTGFYRCLIKSYASISFSLTDFFKKDAFQWDAKAQKAFEELKTAMTHAAILTLQDFNQPFTIQMGASGFAMGAVLTKGHPICYFSKEFPKAIKLLYLCQGTSCNNFSCTKKAPLLIR